MSDRKFDEKGNLIEKIDDNQEAPPMPFKKGDSVKVLFPKDEEERIESGYDGPNPARGTIAKVKSKYVLDIDVKSNMTKNEIDKFLNDNPDQVSEVASHNYTKTINLIDIPMYDKTSKQTDQIEFLREDESVS